MTQIFSAGIINNFLVIWQEVQKYLPLTSLFFKAIATFLGKSFSSSFSDRFCSWLISATFFVIASKNIYKKSHEKFKIWSQRRHLLSLTWPMTAIFLLKTRMIGAMKIMATRRAIEVIREVWDSWSSSTDTPLMSIRMSIWRVRRVSMNFTWAS